MPSTKTRLCLISDTHTLPPNPPSHTTITGCRTPLPTSDILLHAGDITKVSYRAEHEAMISMLAAAPASLKLIIAGNHDISLDAEYFYSAAGGIHRRRMGTDDDDGEESPAAIRALYTSPSAVAAGIRYLDEGTHVFRVPSTGATLRVYASPYQPEFCRWAFAYPRKVDRFNPPRSELEDKMPDNPVPDFPDVDVMLTHGPPRGVLDQVVRTGESVGCEHLLTAVKRARPRLHVFGHIHEGYGAGRMDWGVTVQGSGAEAGFEEIETDPEEVLEHRCAYHDASSTGRPLRFGDETVFVNASVVTVRYQPLNAPWVVDLDLPVEGEGDDDT